MLINMVQTESLCSLLQSNAVLAIPCNKSVEIPAIARTWSLLANAMVKITNRPNCSTFQMTSIVGILSSEASFIFHMASKVRISQYMHIPRG